MRLFLSYHTRDDEAARRLVDALKARRPTFDIYFARQVNLPGAYWVQQLADEIEMSDALVYLAGERVGGWQEIEYQEAYRLSREAGRGGRPRILPVFMTKHGPGLPFFNLLHRISAPDPAAAEVVELIVKALDGVAPPQFEPWRAFNPYKGLAAFTSADAAYFFGREDLTAQILTALAERPSRVFALVGNSGVGKSSIAQAGVLAALRSQTWPGGGAWPSSLSESRSWLPLTLRPDTRPLHSLALPFARLFYESPADQTAEATKWEKLFRSEEASLANLMDQAKHHLSGRLNAEAPKRFVIYVDQGEELYASIQKNGKADAALFSRLLAEAAQQNGARVLLSLRSDYYGQLQADPTLWDASEVIDAPPMSLKALQDAIRKPAAMLGSRFEPEYLPAYLAGAAACEPGALPLVAYLLSDMWLAMQDAGDGVLRRDVGQLMDVSAALRERADRFLAQNEDRKYSLQRLFTLRLTQVPRVGDIMKRRALRKECSPEEWGIAEALAGKDWRLLTLSGQQDGEVAAEVAHEQILRKWPTLDRWLDEERDFLIWKSDLEEDRLVYDKTPASDKHAAFLRGRRLSLAHEWLSSREEDLAQEDIDFIHESTIYNSEIREIFDKALRNSDQISGPRLSMVTIMAGLGALAFEHFFDISWFGNVLSNTSSIYALIVLAMFSGFALIKQALQAYNISECLTLAEREMTWQLRDRRDVREQLSGKQLEAFPLNSPKREELLGARRNNFRDGWLGSPNFGLRGARFNALLLREIYEGNVKEAQKKVEREIKAGRRLYITPGVRALIGIDLFDAEKGFPRRAGVSGLPLWMAVKLYGHPRHLIMVKPDKTVLWNWDVINQLTPKPTEI